MIAAMIKTGHVVAVDLSAGKVRIKSLDWISPWVRWHGIAAGKAKHWRAPSIGEQGTLFSPSGEPSAGRFIAGVFGEAGAAPDNRDHVEVWSFDDGGSLVYDWQAKTYDITLPSGTARITVGGSAFTLTDSAATVEALDIRLIGSTQIEGTLTVTGDIHGGGAIIDTAGNTPNHKH